jgi:hypothetical protein
LTGRPAAARYEANVCRARCSPTGSSRVPGGTRRWTPAPQGIDVPLVVIAIAAVIVLVVLVARAV